MRLVAGLLALGVSFSLSTAAPAQTTKTPSSSAAKGPRKTWTYPMPQRPKPTDPLAKHPAYEVPQSPESIVWKTAAPKTGPNKNVTELPVYSFGSDNRRVRIGTVAVGTDVKLETFRVYGRVNYYAIPCDPDTRAGGGGKSGKNQAKSANGDAWISGLDLAAASVVAPAK
jgi:hypothetical protein